VNLIDQLVLFLLSLVANTFSAFSGGGAGLVQFPILIFLGLTFSTALATHKVASVALGLGAVLRYLSTHHLERRFVLLMLIAGLPGVFIGSRVIVFIPAKIAILALGFLTGGLGLYSIFKTQLGQEHHYKNQHKKGFIIGGVILFLLGILNGSLTSGTGLFVTLWLITWFGLDYQRAVAYTLILVGLFWNGTGAVTLALITEIEWSWLPALLLGSLLGGYIGSHLAIKFGSRWIKRAFELVTLLISIKLIWTGLA